MTTRVRSLLNRLGLAVLVALYFAAAAADALRRPLRSARTTERELLR
ncbi:MAG: hypothetical protein QOF58_3483 [Pseudonocardiales bacterium]|jgi:hypothetical protein|nr:hypothetical protein [Pseudonocardiales bacterium]